MKNSDDLNPENVYVCMVFANIWRFRAPSESKVVGTIYDSHVNRTLLRHEIIVMWDVDERAVRDRSFHSFNFCWKSKSEI